MKTMKKKMIEVALKKHKFWKRREEKPETEEKKKTQGSKDKRRGEGKKYIKLLARLKYYILWIYDYVFWSCTPLE